VGSECSCAFAKLRERSPEYCLILAGQLRKDDCTWQRRDAGVTAKLPSASDLVEELGLTNVVVFTGYIPDAQLGTLYRDAALLVLPSLFEGFGMPAVEALVMGTPTLVSDLPVLREVTNGGAHYIADPRNHEQIADEIQQVLALGDAAKPSPRLRDELRQQFAPLTIARRYVSALLGTQL
jgi:glycosyltransferase involved in cell wall biosynthesis